MLPRDLFSMSIEVDFSVHVPSVDFRIENSSMIDIYGFLLVSFLSICLNSVKPTHSFFTHSRQLEIWNSLLFFFGFFLHLRVLFFFCLVHLAHVSGDGLVTFRFFVSVEIVSDVSELQIWCLLLIDCFTEVPWVGIVSCFYVTGRFSLLRCECFLYAKYFHVPTSNWKTAWYHFRMMRMSLFLPFSATLPTSVGEFLLALCWHNLVKILRYPFSGFFVASPGSMFCIRWLSVHVEIFFGCIN